MPTTALAKRRPKKERVIHTRVPALLEEELKRFAEDMRVPVSNLIRTILEDALAAADHAGERVEHGLRAGAARLAHGRDNLRRTLQGRLPADAARRATRGDRHS
jgi:hypothetical protein